MSSKVFIDTEDLMSLFSEELKKFDLKERDRLTGIVANRDATIYKLRTELESVKQQLRELSEFRESLAVFRKLTNGSQSIPKGRSGS